MTLKNFAIVSVVALSTTWGIGTGSAAAAPLEGGVSPERIRAVMREDLILTKDTREITLKEPLRLLDHLGREWRPKVRAKQALRLNPGQTLASVLSSDPTLKWAFIGETSAVRYATFSQGGPKKLAVSNLPRAQKLLDAKPETVPSFSDVELIETEEAGFYFANEVDEKGGRWASRIQAWLELQAGDARQQDVAKDLRAQILSRGGQP